MEIGMFKQSRLKFDSSDSEEDAKVLARVDLVPGDSRVIVQPSWYQDYSLQTENEKIHSQYLAHFAPVLSVEMEESLWEQVNSKKLSVANLSPPNKTEVRTRIPAGKKKWYFDDSDDDLDDAEIKARDDKLLKKKELVDAARTVGRALLSDTWGLSDSSDDEDPQEKSMDSDWSPKTRREKARQLVQIADEEAVEDEEEEEEGSGSKPPFSQAVDDMFDAATNGKQNELEEIVDALSVMEVPPEEVIPNSGLVVDMLDYVGNTCLMVSCDLGHYEVASYLIKKAKCSLEVANNSGLTALHLATIAGHLDCVQLLVNHAGKGKQSLEGVSLFIFRGHPFTDETARYLGEDNSFPTYEREVAGVSHSATPASESSGGSNRESRRSMVGRPGENKSKFAPCNGTALYWAAARGHLGIAKFLVGMYKPLMDESHTAENDSPLWMALYHRHRDVAKFLVENGADAVATNIAGINIMGVMRIRGMEDPELVAIVKDAISKRKIRELHRRRDAEQAESRRWLAGQGEPEPGPGVVVFLVSIPDKRRSTFKRRIGNDMPVRFLFEAVDIHMADKCGLDLLHGFELHTTTKVLKRRMLEDEVLGDLGFAGARITMEVFPNEPPDEREERLAAEMAAATAAAAAKAKTPASIAGALF